MDNYADITIELSATQFVKLEAKAKENLRSLDAEASFLLSDWVLNTLSKGKHSLTISTGEVCNG